MVQHFVLTLNGSAQRLSSALTNQIPASPAEPQSPRAQYLGLQAGAANSNPVYVGGSTVSATSYGIRIPVPVTTIPDRPIELITERGVALKEVYVIGTNGEKLHITLGGF